MKAKSFLVTGGTGFLGSALVRRLVAGGHRVRVLDNNSRGSSSRLGDVLKNVEMVEGDIRRPETVAKAMRGMDSVLHLAFINGTEFFYRQPELVLDVAVRGMLNVLDACRAEGVKELVLTSSSEVYQSPPVVPTDESAPLSIPDVLNPRYSYGGGKILSELMALHYGRTGFDRVTILRPHNVYGPDMGWEHVIPQLVQKIVKAMSETPNGPVPFSIQGDGSQTRAFIHIDDFIDGFMLVLEGGQHQNIYHIGTREEVSIRDVARKIAACCGREARIQPGPPAPGGTQRRCPDIRKMETLGFSPRIRLDQGLPGVVEWYRAHENPSKNSKP